MNFATTWLVPLQQLTHRRVLPVLSNLSLWVLRLWLGQAFLFAGYTKLAGGLTPPQWFTQLSFPFPHDLLGPALNWLAAGVMECVFGLALILGLGTRLAALGLLYVTYVAVYAVHFDLGWAGWNLIETDAGQGFKVPFMMGIMLLVLLGQGAGRWSLDAYWCQRCLRKSD